MTKIWFSIAMTFNTSLFVSLLLLLLLLPNAKYVSMKRTHKNNTTEKHSANKGFRFFQWSFVQNKTTTTTEEVPDIFEFEDDQELDINIKLDNRIVEESIANSTSNSSIEEHDYQLNTDEILATEPPEMEVLAMLVDENGQVEHVDEDETEAHETHEELENTPSPDNTSTTTDTTETTDTTDTTTTTTTTTTTNTTETTDTTTTTDTTETTDTTTTTETTSTTETTDTMDNTDTTLSTISSTVNTINETTLMSTKRSKFGELRKGDPISSIRNIYQKQLIKKNLTEQARKKNCLEYTQDSGYWCEGTIGRLEIKYYYEKTTETCECFLYYGCFGNKNNFDSIRECEDSCKPFAIHGFKRQKGSTVVCTINP